MPSSSAEPTLSIVVGSNGEGLEVCLAALAPQVDGAEVLVCEPAPSPDELRDRFPFARFHVRPGALVPALWRDGIDASTGSIVALTISPMRPAPDWVETIRALGEREEVVAGAIDPAPDLRIADWAEYLCRYARDMLPFDGHQCLELPGDNAAYRRDALERTRPLYRDGFWEPEVNRRLRDEGARLWHTPELVVRQGRSAGARAFTRQRLAHGRALPKSEIQLPLGGLWLEVSTYPIRGDEATPLGAVLVLEDRTAQKELAARKRQAEESQLLARVIARIADEIKNPLVSINTFVELIDERYDDPDFRKLFSSVVRRDVRRLVQVFEKLAGLVSEGELNFSTVDVHAVIDEVVTAVELSDEGLGKRLNFDVTRDARPQVVRVDAAQLRKSLSYLVWYLAHNSPGEDAKVTLSVGRHAGPDEPEAVRIIIGSRTAAVPADKLGRLFDPVQMVQESLIDVGPAVSQRLIEAQGGRLQFRQGRHELAFHISLTPVES